MPRPELIGEGEALPEFTLPAADNSSWSLAHLLRGERALLIFYRRDCPASRALLPLVERMHRRLARARLRIAGVAQDNHRDTLELADGYQLTFPLLLDHPRFALSRELGVREVPTQIWFSPSGRVEGTLVGFSRTGQEQLFLRLARELGQVEQGLLHAGDLIPERVAGWPSASAGAEPGS